MSSVMRFSQVSNYPIDCIPLDDKGFVRFNKSALDRLIESHAGMQLKTGYGFLCLMLENDLSRKFPRSRKSDNAEGFFFLANTGCFLHSIIPNRKVDELSMNQCRIAITDLDHAILGFIHQIYISADKLYQTQEENDDNEQLKALIAIFHKIQCFERDAHKTIDIAHGDDDILLNQILTNVDSLDTLKNLVDIDESIVKRIDDVISNRIQLSNEILRLRREQREYSKNTNNSLCWELFIRYLNSCSAEETRLLEIIPKKIDPQTKLASLKNYIYPGDAKKTKKILNSNLTFYDLLKRIKDRVSEAGNYCWVKTSDSRLVNIDLSWLGETIIHDNFHHILFAYHIFMIEPTYQTMAPLSLMIYTFLKKNLGYNVKFKGFPTNENFFTESSDLIMEFYEWHKDVINKLKFDHIHEDESLFSPRGFYDAFDQIVVKTYGDLDTNLKQNFSRLDLQGRKCIIEALNKAITLNISAESFDRWYDDFLSACRSVMSDELFDETKVYGCEVAKRLILSINTIYILIASMSKAVEKDILPLLKNDDDYILAVKRRLKELSNLEQFLVRTTYISPDYYCFDSIDMDAYRIRMGIDSTAIEINNQDMRQISMLEIAKIKIKELHSQIENCDLDEIANYKNELRKELCNFQDCEMKDCIMEIFDQESEFICNLLITHKAKQMGFNAKKEGIRKDLGTKVVYLPDETMNALTTAELLFEQYAVPDYAQSDFDYSCISSLYYQAVESLYNKILWKQYASKLNKKTYKNDRFAYLYKKRKLPLDLQGYLPEDTPEYYTPKEKNIVFSILTLGTFSCLIKHLSSVSGGDLPRFSKYVDSVFKMDKVSRNSEEYTNYQKKMDEFCIKISDAVPRRNNASHGEEPLDLNECQKDRRTVFAEVESVRTGTLGIIQLFLSLYKNE